MAPGHNWRALGFQPFLRMWTPSTSTLNTHGLPLCQSPSTCNTAQEKVPHLECYSPGGSSGGASEGRSARRREAGCWPAPHWKGRARKPTEKQSRQLKNQGQILRQRGSLFKLCCPVSKTYFNPLFKSRSKKHHNKKKPQSPTNNKNPEKLEMYVSWFVVLRAETTVNFQYFVAKRHLTFNPLGISFIKLKLWN